MYYEEVGLSEDDNERSADIKVKFYISMPWRHVEEGRGTAPLIRNLRIWWTCQINIKHGKIVKWPIDCLAALNDNSALIKLGKISSKVRWSSLVVSEQRFCLGGGGRVERVGSTSNQWAGKEISVIHTKQQMYLF